MDLYFLLPALPQSESGSAAAGEVLVHCVRAGSFK